MKILIKYIYFDNIPVNPLEKIKSSEPNLSYLFLDNIGYGCELNNNLLVMLMRLQKMDSIVKDLIKILFEQTEVEFKSLHIKTKESESIKDNELMKVFEDINK